MIDFGYHNMDCMEGMKEIPDKFFDLAIVDPPYGIDIGSEIGGGVVNPKDTRRSMTVTHRTPRISRNCFA